VFGLGTGVAPFRAFLQHREMLQKQNGGLGPATLYVGFRHEARDFYLQNDYEEWIKNDILTNVHPAFSHNRVEERDGKLIIDDGGKVGTPKPAALRTPRRLTRYSPD
jgi:sulfite reductase alpha subunit-like flavoprotein